MVPQFASHKLLSLTAVLLFPLLILVSFYFTPIVFTQNIRLQQDLEQQFLQHQRLTLDTTAVAAQVRETGRLSLATSDLSFDLQLAPHDMRAVGYRAEEFGADGVAHAIEIGPVRTFRGRAQATRNGEQLPQLGEARFTIDEKGIEGLIITPTEHYFVEPAGRFSKAANSSDYVIYRESDVVSNSTGECGTTLSEQVGQRAEAVRRENAQAISQFMPQTNQTPSLASGVEKQTPFQAGPAVSESSLFNFDTLNSRLAWEPLSVFNKEANQATQLKMGFESADIQPPLPFDCDTEPISSGQQLNKTLDSGCALQSGQLTDIFSFSGIAGQQVSITMSSSAFDTYLYLWYQLDTARSLVAPDDNGAGGTDSRIPAVSGMYTLPATGTYYIYATSVLLNQTGNYTIAFSLTTPPPANDSFSNAQLISGTSGNLRGSNVSATKESGEPRHANNAGGASVWYRWQATTNGTAIFNTAGSEFDTLLAVYSGQNVDSLTTIAQNNNFNGLPQSRVSFTATQGTTYYIAVDGFNGANGVIQLNWNPPLNDDFASAQLISGAFGTVFGSNVGATKEAGEPNHSDNSIGGASVWYRWVAPSNGTVRFTTKARDLGWPLKVYTGSSVSSLTIADGSISLYRAITFQASAGSIYYIAVDGYRALDGSSISTGNITLSWLVTTPIQPPPPAPANDNFANAQILSGSADEIIDTNVSASKEEGEPNHAEYGGVSVWYSWQAPRSGTATFTTSGSHFDTLLAVYTGSTLNALTPITSNDDDPQGGIQSTVTFLAVQGVLYYIAIDGYVQTTGSITLNWTLPPPPANDSFATAEVINGAAGSVSGTNNGASKESGEPNHAGYIGGASVWYKWQAPNSGSATFNTAGSNFDTLLGVYTGSSLNSLTRLAGNDDASSGNLESSVTFPIGSGAEYYIAVDGFKAAIGNAKLNWTTSTATPTPTPTPLPTPVSIPTPPFLSLQVATEADYEYVLGKGGSAAAAQEILSIMNQVEGIYESQLGLTLKVSYQSTWNTSNQPYTSTNPSALLSELANYWNANRGSVGRDVVHMWTAKELDNSTIGTAYLEALCRFTGNGRAAYGLSKSVSENQQISITAHEIGHNLGATHPNQQVPQPAGCDNTVMSSSVSTTPQLDFCPYSVNEIANYLAGSINCLSRDASHLSFAVPKNLPLGPMSDVAVGDFNNDGKQDLVAKYSDGIAVLLGSDSGDLVGTFNYPFGSSPAVGDFDQDGKQDLVVVSPSGGTVTVLRGNGSGVFEPAGEYAAGKGPSRIVVSDFNADARQDLAAFSGEDISVLLGNDSGGFQAPHTTSDDTRGRDLFVGQFTSDNAPDLLVVGIDTHGHWGTSLLRNTGSGGFEGSFSPGPFESKPNAAVGDLNGDGASDIVLAESDRAPDDSGFMYVLMSDGAGGFRGSSVQLSFSDALGIVIGDFSGDGNADLAIAGGPSAGIEIRYGNGTDLLPGPTSYNLPASGRLAVGDFNGDGNQDLVDLSNASVALGSNTGLQAPRQRPHTYPTALAAADFNRDGNQDVVVVRSYDHSFLVDSSTPNATVLFGTGTGDFAGSVVVATFLPQTHLTDVTAGDFNNDGLADFATIPGTAKVGDFGKGLGVVLANSSGFEAPLGYTVGSNPSAVTAGDFNADGKLDLAVANSNGTNGEILLLPGGNNGIFQSPVAVATIGSSPSDLAAGDFNSDGSLDLAVTYESSDVVSVLLGTSGAGFLPRVNFALGAQARTVTVGDFNFDHKLDLAVAGTSVLLGKGDGSFGSPIRFGGGGNVGIAAADFNGDNKTDIAAASGLVIPSGVNKGSVSVLLNNTGNSFNAPFNDNFADARGISGPNGSLAGTTVLATKEIGEPNHASASNGTGGASIWYRWKAPFTGKFYFQTFSSSFPSVIAVYTGTSLSTLVTLAKSTSIIPEFVEFDATAGTTYRIAIDGVNGDTGRTVLTWNTGSLSNDNFGFAREIRGISSSVNGDNTNFTLEPNEPTLPGPSATGFSAWYRWTAPSSGKVSFLAEPPASTQCGDTTRALGAYTGNFLDILSLVAVNYDGYREFHDSGACDNRSLRFNAVAGTTYRIQLRSVIGKPFTLKWNYADPPANDNFANALILAGNSGSVVGTNRDATKELGEPNHAGGAGGASIWYRWTAPVSGPVTFDTIGFRNQGSNSFHYLTALLAVYTGSSLNALTPVVTSSSPDNKVTFTATAGTTYQIAVDSGPYVGGGYLPGIVPLHWGAKQVSNDDFANAQGLSAAGSFSPLLGSNVGATKEAGEPNHQGNMGGTSVWYRWTALTDGNASFVFNTCATCTLSASNALISVYTGGSVNGLTPVPATADSNHTFSGVRGTTYFIAVDSNTGAGGTYEFSLVSSNISARNDTYANAQVLSGSAGAVAGDNSGATKEAAEPNHANDIGGASVWYQWTAPASGLYTFDTFGSNFDTLLGVYSGNVVSALSTVASSDNARSSSQSRVTFNAIVDTTYFIAVDGKSTGIDQGTGLSRSQTGFILLNWNNLPPPVNDNFANAQVISGLAGNATGRNTVASKEGGEPNHAGNPGGVSVWYQWTAPGTGKVTFNTFGSDFNTLLGVYTGSAVNALTSVSSNDDVGDLRQSRVTFNAVAGTVYYIGVDGSVGVPGSVTPFTGNVVLSWFPELDGGNDSFAQAQTLSGSSGSVAGTNVGATKENGEPNHAGDRGGRSLWYSWTAPFNGPAILTTAGSDFDTLLAVYTGASVAALTPVAGNDDSPYSDNPGHILSSSLTFTASAGITYKIVVDGSGGRFGNFGLRWGPEAKISGQVSFLGGPCGSDKKVSMILSGEDARAVSFTGSGTYSFEHLRLGGNYSVRGISANCLPLFLERAKSFFPLAGDVFDANFVDDGLRGGGSTSNITGHVTNAGGLGLYNVAIALSGSAARTVYTDSAGLYLLPNLPAGTYQVTPSKAGAVFSPASIDFTFTSGRTITDADFGTQDSYNISGQTRNGDGNALSGVTVTLSNGVIPATVQTDENGYYSFDAVTGGSYLITAAKTGLNFSPATRSISGLNANTKNLDFSASTQTQTLTVMTANPNSGVNITITPNDNSGQGNGTTQFSRVYSSLDNVTLTAPASVAGNLFQKWLRDGLDFSTSQSTSVTMDADHTLTAVYVTTVAQTPTGQNVTVQLNSVTVTFANVTGAGNTTIMPINPSAAGQLPNGYQLAGSGLAFDITTTAIVQPPIIVCFSVPAVTDPTAFSQLRILHNESGTLIDRTSSQDFATKMICATVNSLSPFVLATTTVPRMQLLLDESGPGLNQVAALDSVLFLRDPFPVIYAPNLFNLGSDRNTRLLIFVRHLQLAPGETAASVVVTLVDSNNQSYDISAENVWSGPSNDFSQVTFRLPDTLATGTCTIEVRAHGQVSNPGTMRIRL